MNQKTNTVHPEDTNIYVIFVVALDKEFLPKRVYKNFYLTVKGNMEEAEEYQKLISRVGFISEGERTFADDIESINLRLKEDDQ